jgi:preprotein translocase subunit SecE
MLGVRIPPGLPENNINIFANILNCSFLIGLSIDGKEVGVAMAANIKSKKSNVGNAEDPSPFSPAQIKKFVDEVKAEFFKIVWPDKKTTLGLTGIVTTLTVIISLYLGSVDLLLGKLVSMFIR